MKKKCFFQSNNNYKATSAQDKHLQKEPHWTYSPGQLLCYVGPRTANCCSLGKAAALWQSANARVWLGEGTHRRKEESLERNREKADNTILCNSSFNITFIDLLHISQYRRHRVLQSIHMHSGTALQKPSFIKHYFGPWSNQCPFFASRTFRPIS